MTRARALWALSASVGLHALPLSAALAWRGPPRAPTVLPASSDESEAPAAVWGGETFDIDTLPAGTSKSQSKASLPVPVSFSPAPKPASPASPEPVVAREKDAPPPRAREQVPSSSQPRTGDESAAPGAGTYGAAGATALSAPLGKGLLRVLPRAAFVESIFHDLPLGASARLRFTIELDGEGHATLPVHFDDDQPRVPWLEALLGRAVLLLRGGAFSLPPGVTGPASSSFELELRVTQGAAENGDWAEPRDLAEIGRLVEPTRARPGRAHFRYNSGRKVEFSLSLR